MFLMEYLSCTALPLTVTQKPRLLLLSGSAIPRASSEYCTLDNAHAASRTSHTPLPTWETVGKFSLFVRTRDKGVAWKVVSQRITTGHALHEIQLCSQGKEQVSGFKRKIPINNYTGCRVDLGLGYFHIKREELSMNSFARYFSMHGGMVVAGQRKTLG